MPTKYKVEHRLIPVTAIAFVRLKSRLLVFSGQGPDLQVFDNNTRRLLYSERLFEGVNIHGIKIDTHEAVAELGNDHTQILAWAGQSICVADVAIQDDTNGDLNIIITLLVKLQADDWVQDACFRPGPEKDSGSATAILLTSHNVLYGLFQAQEADPDGSSQAALYLIAAGPPSLLYCAHIVWPEHGRGLVAAGTVLGAVLFWSFPTTSLLYPTCISSPHRFHCTLEAHEGAVFGVRVFKPSVEFGANSARCFVASCSDDRTICIWDVTGWDDRDFSEQTQDQEKAKNADYFSQGPGKHVATVMGHSSRIWGIHFLNYDKGLLWILSFGEDCTMRVWRHRVDPGSGLLSQAHLGSSLEHEATYSFHNGKNIWAVDVQGSPMSDYLVTSGGADGRVVSYELSGQKPYVLAGQSLGRYPMETVRSSLQENMGLYGEHIRNLSSAITSRSSPRSVFAALKGTWKLERSLHSEIPAYPTGIYSGVATFQERDPTNQAFDSEYLYVEKGQFTTNQGASLSATRRYVYRFLASSNQISAWFVKPEDGVTVDYLFHVLQLKPTIEDLNICLKAHHLCSADNYWVEYNFALDDLNSNGFSVKYIVKGPNKDYTTEAKYTRDVQASGTAERASIDGIGSEASLDHIEGPTNTTPNLECPIAKNDSFKSYAWIDKRSFLVTTDHGWLFVGSLNASSVSDKESKAGIASGNSHSWTLVAQEARLEYSCVAATIETYGLVLLSGQDGTIFCFQAATGTLRYVMKLPRKITCFNISSQDSKSSDSKYGIYPQRFVVFAACTGSSIAYHLTFNYDNDMFECTQIRLEVPEGFLPTSSIFFEADSTLIVGSRKGALAIYYVHRIEDDLVSPEIVIPYVHSGETVTTMKSIPSLEKEYSPGSRFFLSAGRDGRYLVHCLTTHSSRQPRSQSKLQTVHSCSLPFGTTIEGMIFDKQSQDLHLWGFRGKNFVVWNNSLSVDVMSVECGGAHRSWAYTPLEATNGGGNFVCTKASVLITYSQVGSSHSVLQHGGHGREIKATAVSPPIEGYDHATHRYLATGAEDTRVRIFGHTHLGESHSENTRCLHVLCKHTTGVQQLRWSSNGQLLFSVAGREEFFVWQVRPVPYFDIGVVCLSVCPPVSESHDLRIMDLDVLDVIAPDNSAMTRYVLGVVYSDSTLRLFHYDPFNAQTPFRLLSVGHYTSYCLTQASFVRIDTRVHFLTASTDGCVALWPLNLEDRLEDVDQKPHELYSSYETSLGLICVRDSLNPIQQIQTHQSSINCVSTMELSNQDILITSVGDDGALGLSRVTGTRTADQKAGNDLTLPEKSGSDNVVITASTLLIPKAHSCAISALIYLGLETDTPDSKQWLGFMTCGKDQKLRSWRVKAGLEKPGVQEFTAVKGEHTHTSIADVSSLELVASGDAKTPRILVAGIGMELLRMDAAEKRSQILSADLLDD